jgi:hypothetical protein
VAAQSVTRRWRTLNPKARFLRRTDVRFDLRYLYLKKQNIQIAQRVCTLPAPPRIPARALEYGFFDPELDSAPVRVQNP